MKRAAILLGIGGTIACSNHPSVGSGTLQPAVGSNALYAVLGDHGQIARIDLATQQTTRIDVGKEPTRIATAGGKVYVTLRGERAIAVLEEQGSALAVVGKLPVGAEPYGIVAAGGKLYVANSQSGEVDAIDPSSGRTQLSWKIAGEPRWLAMHPSGQSLYVGSAFGGLVTRIDIGTGQFEPVALPERGAPSMDPSNPTVSLSKRITGDLAVSDDGTHLYVPMLFVDNINPIDDSAAIISNMGGTPPPVDCAKAAPQQNGPALPCGGPGGYSGGGRFQPMLVDMTVDPDHGRVSASSDARTLIPIFGGIDKGPVAGYPAAVTPTKDWIFVTVEGSGALVAVSAHPDPTSGQSFAPLPHGPSTGFFGDPVVSRTSYAFAVGDGARGIAQTSDGRVFAHAAFDHQVTEIDLSSLKQMSSPPPREVIDGPGLAMPAGQTGIVMTVADEVLPADVATGRRLFYSTIDPRVVEPGAALSCATCHFETRNDGLTWHFVRAPGGLQTPPLAGGLIGAMPLTWAGDVDSVAHEALLTSQFRMGGTNLDSTLADQIGAFVNSTRDVDVELKGSSDARVQHGKELFERPDVGCASCHNGARMTNNSIVSMFGMSSVKVRPLVGIAASAPYLHDGAAATLHDLLELVRDGSMGNTSNLSDADIDDLELYLRSL
jgi:hypothetical protein